MNNEILWLVSISAMVFVAMFLLVTHGYEVFRAWLRKREAWYQRVLVEQLLMEIEPKTAVGLSISFVIICSAATYAIGAEWPWAVVGAIAGFFLPTIIIKHLEQKRRQKLDEQIVDGITTLASGVRAGLNLVQAIEVLVKNSTGPIRQEFAQLLREYQMGLDLNQAMRNAANRIGSSHYRLLFTAIEMHRLRGGDVGQSMDRIASAIREIQRLEGRLETLTAPGRTQARMMAGISLAMMLIMYSSDPQGVSMLFVEPNGRILLLFVAGIMTLGFVWIRKIVDIDI